MNKEGNVLSDDAKRFKAWADQFNLDFTWNEYCNNIKAENVFVLDPQYEAFIQDVVRKLIDFSLTKIKKDDIYYRARIINGDELTVEEYFADYDGVNGVSIEKSQIRGFQTEKDNGAPPKEKVVAGRANPKGVSYLYLATNEYTAVSEVRPVIGDCVNVAAFKAKEDLNVIKLPLSNESLLKISGNLPESINVYNFLQKFIFEFARPVKNSEKDYLPTQCLAESIKLNTEPLIDGILYASLQSNSGENLVMFDPSKMKWCENIQERVVKIENISYSCYNLNDLSDKIQQTQPLSPITKDVVEGIKRKIYINQGKGK